MITKNTITFNNNINEITSCDFYFDNSIISGNSSPFVLFTYGFRAFNDWGFIPYFAERFASNGFIFGVIDFSLNTLSDRERQLFDMDRFRRNTVTQMLTEARMLLNNLSLHLGQCGISDRWSGDVYLVGHSLGGALAIALADSNSAENSFSIKKLVTICSISDIDIYTIRQKEQWEELGYKEFVDTTTGQNIILDVSFLRDRLTYTGDRSLAAMISRLNIPTYFIHTEADATVSPKSLNILSDSFTKKELLRTELVPKANHLLNCTHPFEGTNDALELIINNVISFYLKDC